MLQLGYIGMATKWLRIFSLPPNEKIRNHLVANPIASNKVINYLSMTMTQASCTRPELNLSGITVNNFKAISPSSFLSSISTFK